MSLAQKLILKSELVLFTINYYIQNDSFICIQSNGSKYIYISVTIKHQLFVYTQLNDQTVLFQTIQSNMSTKLNDSKYCYISQTIQLIISYLFTHS